MNPLIQLKKTTPVFLIAVVLGCFALLPRAQAQLMPTPGGSYPNDNTALGGITALFHLSTGAENTALGVNSMFLETTGNKNTAVGDSALKRNTTGSNNTATGIQALFNNTTASNNTAVGNVALWSNTTGGTFGGTAFAQGEVGPNVAVGTDALFSNTIAGANVAVGYLALSSMTTGATYDGAVNEGASTAVGFEALAFAGAASNTGFENSAFGYQALVNDTVGARNVGIGYQALHSNTEGTGNTALGTFAGFFQTTGSGNIYIGFGAGSVAGESDHTYINNINTTSVSGANADTVTVELGSGLLGHLSSSRRYKEDIKPMSNASGTLYRLKPVTYRYRKEIDPTRSLAFGLVAEDVAQVNPDLVARNSQGQPESVHYEMVNAMLLNEFLKEHCTVQDLKAIVADQQKQIKALTAGLQKVNAQIELKTAAPQTVVNNQ